MKYKIIRDKEYLHRKTEPVNSIEEGQEIAKHLLAVLDDLRVGIGLSAIQLGILKSVSVVNVRKENPPLILINPIITDYNKDKVIFAEACLSLPGKVITTIRSTNIMVSSLNWANPLPFGPDVTPVTEDSLPTDYGLLETICVQHEVDHLNGVLITDPGVRYVKTIQKAVKHGRNDKVLVEKDGETQYIKYKKALDLVSDGWKII